MARREVRYSGLTQKQLQKLEKMKKKGNPRRDGRSWTDKLFDKLKGSDETDGQDLR